MKVRGKLGGGGGMAPYSCCYTPYLCCNEGIHFSSFLS